jgi:hypothetical protein
VERGVTSSLKFCPLKKIERALEKAMRSYDEVIHILIDYNNKCRYKTVDNVEQITSAHILPYTCRSNRI